MLLHLEINKMRYAKDYRLICQPIDQEIIAITIPTGETNLSRVRNDVYNNFGSVDIIEVDFSTFLSIYPGDRIFRNAWQIGRDRIIENVSLARNVIRNKRDCLLNYLDPIAWRETRKPNGNVKAVDTVSQ